MLNGYHIMWMMVMFDLPVTTSKERKLASGFRNHLLNLGFEMSQFSVYFRFCGDREKTKPYVAQIRQGVPLEGKVSILFFTDKQFGNIIHLSNRKPAVSPKKPTQLALF